MKKKLMMLLCVCTLMAGCGEATTGGPAETGAGEEFRVVMVQDAEGTGSDHTESMSREEKQAEVLQNVVLEDPFQRAAYFADQIYAGSGENTLVSPLSLNLALGLVLEGTSGETAGELGTYLGREDYGSFAKEYMELAKERTQRMEKNSRVFEKYSFQYCIANSIWVNKGRKLTREYQKAAKENYMAEVEILDFAGKKTAAVKKINAWCEKQTNGMIREIINENALSDSTAAVLINSIYFESPWRKPWNSEKHEFTGLSGKVSEQEMLDDWVDGYYEDEAATAFGKNYQEGFEFIGILPKAEGEFQIGDLDLESLLASRTSACEVHAIMPKMDFETSTGSREIVNLLKAQGVTKVFDVKTAEFDRMLEWEDGGKDPVYIDDIIQKCKIELDENGTKAAAVTAIVTNDCAAAVAEPLPVKEVFLDRPFAFIIYDTIKEEIVFLGKVTELN